MDTAAAALAPRCRKALATGTMQAEHRFIAGPTTSPPVSCVSNRPRFPGSVQPLLPAGNRKVSVSPAIRKANPIPSDTRRR